MWVILLLILPQILKSAVTRSTFILLEQRKEYQVRVNEAVIFDIPPFFMAGGMDWFAQVGGGISLVVTNTVIVITLVGHTVGKNG